jgi:competence ComEA-like helix-hairpin-helix protein
MFASGFSLLAPEPSFAPGSEPPPRSVRGISPVFPEAPEATGGHGGPLTVRQGFLLGKLVDINRAGYQELSGLPGISDLVAKAIVKERTRRGGFRRPEDLLAVRGIKEKRLKKILPFVAIFPNN